MAWLTDTSHGYITSESKSIEVSEKLVRAGFKTNDAGVGVLVVWVRTTTTTIDETTTEYPALTLETAEKLKAEADENTAVSIDRQNDAGAYVARVHTVTRDTTETAEWKSLEEAAEIARDNGDL